jgi:hypothetical protein
MLRCLLQLRRGLASATDDGPDRRLSAAAGRRIGCLFVVVALVLTVVVMGALSKALDVAANPRQHARSPRHTNATSIAAAQPPREPFCTTAADPRSKKHKLVSQPATETALPGTWYAVDDGCALGHMAKDVATLSFLALRQPIRGIIFLHPCATKAEWDKAAVLGAAASSASTGSLFQTVLAPLFQAAVNLSHHHQSTAQPLRVHFAADFAATDTLCYDRVLFRSTQWRWFGPIGARESIVASQQYQHSLAQTVGATVDGAAAPADARSRIRVLVVDRTRTRRWVNVTGLASRLRSVLPPILFTEIDVVVLERESLASQVGRLRRADITIAAHGAALALAGLAMRGAGGSGILEVFPPSFRYLIFEELALSAGIHYRSLSAGATRHRPVASGTCAECAVRQSPAVLAAALTERDALRALNGWSGCKNCDLYWDDGLVDAIATAVTDMARAIWFRRAGEALGSGDGLSVRDLDRRA